MRHGANPRRARNHRNHNNNGGRRSPSNRVHTYDSNGPDVRIRGNAFQINEKYLTLARDAAAAGDRVLAESYLQHAEHYQRVINELTGEDAIRADQPDAPYQGRESEISEGEPSSAEQPFEDDARGNISAQPQQQGEGGGNQRHGGGRHQGGRHRHQGRGQYRGRDNNNGEPRQSGGESGKAGFEAADTPSFLAPKTPANEPDAG